MKKPSSNFPEAEISVWLMERDCDEVRVSDVAAITEEKQSIQIEKMVIRELVVVKMVNFILEKHPTFPF